MYPKCEWKDSTHEFNEPFLTPLPPVNNQSNNAPHEAPFLRPHPNTTSTVCQRLAEYHGLSKIIQSVLDISAVVTKIMKICYINQCKCEHAIDLIIYAFLHFDEYSGTRQCCHTVKQICKDELQYELRRQCNFTIDEVKLGYKIMKYAFHAFYFKQAVPRYDSLIFDELSWKIAINKTIKAYKGLSSSDTSTFATVTANIKTVYQDYIDKRKKIRKCPLVK